MASLIPAEVMAQMIARQGQVPTVNTGQAQTMPGYAMDNPSMQLQNAHAQAVAKGRGQTSTPQTGPGNKGPMSASLTKAMMIDQAGLDENEKQKFHQAAQEPGTTPQMLQQLLKGRQQQVPQQGGSMPTGRSIGALPQGGMAIANTPIQANNPHQEMSPEARDQQEWYRTIAGRESGQMPSVKENKGGTQVRELDQNGNPIQRNPHVFQGSTPPAPAPTKEQLAQQQATDRGARQDQNSERQAQHQQFMEEHTLIGELRGQQREMESTGMQDQPQYKQLSQQIDQLQQKHQQRGGGQQQSQGQQAPQAVARNPKTGETLHFINGQWTPAK